MFDDPKGPIEHFSWGKFVVRELDHSKSGAETIRSGQDIRLVGQEVTEWHERKGHRLQRSMITGITDPKIAVLIIGAGVFGRLKCPKNVKQSLREEGIQQVILESTPQACRTYNELFHQGKGVALLAHGTC